MAEDNIKRIWEILTTFTKEAQNTAIAKCKEFNFDPNRGEISLDESLINLNATKLIIMDAFADIFVGTGVVGDIFNFNQN